MIEPTDKQRAEVWQNSTKMMTLYGLAIDAVGVHELLRLALEPCCALLSRLLISERNVLSWYSKGCPPITTLIK